MNHRDAAEFDELFQRVTTLETLLEHTLTLGAKLHERLEQLEQVVDHDSHQLADIAVAAKVVDYDIGDPTPTWTLEFAEHVDPHGWTYLNCTLHNAGVVLGGATISHPTQAITYPETTRHHQLTAARMAIADAIDNRAPTT